MKTTTGTQISGSEQIADMPNYLARYAADVDRWHSQALTARETR